MVRHEIVSARMAGVLVPTRRPYAPLVLDQVAGKNGKILDDKAGAGDLLHKGKVRHEAGISGSPLERTFSTAFRN